MMNICLYKQYTAIWSYIYCVQSHSMPYLLQENETITEAPNIFVMIPFIFGNLECFENEISRV